MPMLTVVKTSWPPTLIGVVISRCSRWATRIVSFTSSTPSRRTANSSPPKRATVSRWRRHFCMRAAVATSSWSALGGPGLYVDDLEALRVEKEDCEEVSLLRLLGALEGEPEVIQEEGAVGQPVKASWKASCS